MKQKPLQAVNLAVHAIPPDRWIINRWLCQPVIPWAVYNLIMIIKGKGRLLSSHIDIMSVVDCTNVSVEYVSSIFRTEEFSISSPTLVPIYLKYSEPDLGSQINLHAVGRSNLRHPTPLTPVSSVPEALYVDQLGRTWHTTCCSTRQIEDEF